MSSGVKQERYAKNEMNRLLFDVAGKYLSPCEFGKDV